MNGDQIYTKLTNELGNLTTVVEERWKSHAERSVEFRDDMKQRLDNIDRNIAELFIEMKETAKDSALRQVSCAQAMQDKITSREVDAKILWFLGGFSVILTIIISALKIMSVL